MLIYYKNILILLGMASYDIYLIEAIKSYGCICNFPIKLKVNIMLNTQRGHCHSKAS